MKGRYPFSPYEIYLKINRELELMGTLDADERIKLLDLCDNIRVTTGISTIAALQMIRSTMDMHSSFSSDMAFFANRILTLQSIPGASVELFKDPESDYHYCRVRKAGEGFDAGTRFQGTDPHSLMEQVYQWAVDTKLLPDPLEAVTNDDSEQSEDSDSTDDIN
jgi:hypothetical protein